MCLSSRRSLAIREAIRRRSVSSLVSPGPRPPMPPPCEPTRPPAWRDRLPPQPRSRCLPYSSCASSTCALPSLDLACWAKMSRISAVRSTTLTLTRSSRLRSCDGLSSPSQITVSAPVWATTRAQVVDLARADVRRRVGLLPPLRQRVEHLRAGRLGEQLELDQRVVGVLDGAVGPDADQDDPLEPELAVLDLGDVLELGRQAGDPAQRVALVELVVALAVVVVATAVVARGEERLPRQSPRHCRRPRGHPPSGCR